MSECDYDEIELNDDNIETYTCTDIHVNCPKCGQEYDEYNIEYEKTYEIECEKCGNKYSFSYCPY